MAGQVRESSFNIKLDLLNRGHEFSFFQTLRLLRIFDYGTEEHGEGRMDERLNIRVRPDLSLVFPSSDLVGVEELDDDRHHFRVTATFLGLYGISSPLPTFYTEDLIDEASQDRSAIRDFIDILNHPLYILLYRCWIKYRQFVQVAEENDPRDIERLFCLLGLGEKELREDLPWAAGLLRYAGLFTQFPRSSVGLETLLKDALEGVDVEVIPCIRRRIKIPGDQRLLLGTSGNYVGENSFLGEEIDDRMGKICLQIGPLTSEQFHSLLPGNPLYRKIAFLAKFYCTDPIEFDFVLSLAKAEVQTVCLGAPRWSRLGWDTWTFSGDRPEVVSAAFPSQYNEEMKL